MKTPTVPPPEVASSLSKVQLQGQGALRFFGLLVYDVRLWTPPGFVADRYDVHPLALEVAYARKLDGPAIAERSIAEMARVGEFNPGQSQAWLALMLRAFPDVKAGDRLVGVHDGQGQVRFYFNGQQTAAITDQRYAQLFFGIWLSTRTSAPALRHALVAGR